MIAPLLGAKGFVLMDSRMQGESFSLDGGGKYRIQQWRMMPLR